MLLFDNGILSVEITGNKFEGWVTLVDTFKAAALIVESGIALLIGCELDSVWEVDALSFNAATFGTELKSGPWPLVCSLDSVGIEVSKISQISSNEFLF